MVKSQAGPSDVGGPEFRCLVANEYREQIDAVAFELNARVGYFRGPMNAVSISRDGQYLGCGVKILGHLGKLFWRF